MATRTAIYFEKTSVPSVEAAIHSYFATAFPHEELLTDTSKLMPIYGDLFHFGSNPTAFSVAACPKNWCTVHFNCFCRMEEFASNQSQKLATRVVVANIQTNSCCYYIGVHELGNLRRAFNYQDGEWTLQHGTPYSFEEKTPLGDDIRESDVERFCSAMGLHFMDRECYPENWLHIQLAKQPEKRKALPPVKPLRWWQRFFKRPMQFC